MSNNQKTAKENGNVTGTYEVKSEYKSFSDKRPDH